MAEIDTKSAFTNMFSQGKTNIVNDIISGNLYVDNKTVSQRIWSYGFDKDIQYTIHQAKY